MNFISICGQSFFPAPVSGGDVLNFELLKRLDRKDDAYLLINEITAPYARKSLPCQVIVIKDWLNLNKLVQKHLLFAPLAFVNSAIKIDRILRGSFDHPLILYSAGDFICNIVPMVLHKRRHPRSRLVVRIFHIHKSPFKRWGNPFWASLFSFIFQRVSLILIKKYADLVFLLNSEVREALLKSGFDSEKMYVLGAGVDLAKIRGAEAPVGRGNTVFFFGRLSPTKGVFDLLKIWSLVLEEEPEARLVVIGTGSEAVVGRLKNEFTSEGILDTVEFMGFIKEIENVYKILKGGKVFISPSYEEGWGITVFEAIGCDLSPVVYDLPVFREIFAETIQAVPVGDKVAFAKAIVKFLNDEELGEDYVGRLNEVVKKYDWDEIFRRELRLIGVRDW